VDSPKSVERTRGARFTGFIFDIFDRGGACERRSLISGLYARFRGSADHPPYTRAASVWTVRRKFRGSYDMGRARAFANLG
jgi:hypothetical protein